MTNKYYQNHNERLRKEANERYKNLSEGEKDKCEKSFEKNIKIFLKNKSRSYLSI